MSTLEELQRQQICKRCEQVLRIRGTLSHASELSGTDAWTELGQMVATGAMLRPMYEPSTQRISPAPPSINTTTSAASSSGPRPEGGAETPSNMQLVSMRSISTCSPSPSRSLEDLDQPQHQEEATIFNAIYRVGGHTGGYVQTSEGRIYCANAILGRNVYRNVISVRKAEKLNLEVHLVDANRRVWLKFENGLLRPSIGFVEFDWAKDSSTELDEQYPPLRVCCEVCEHPKSLLILGKPFMDARKQYWQD